MFFDKLILDFCNTFDGKIILYSNQSLPLKLDGELVNCINDKA